MQLTANFSLTELTATNTGLPNIPGPVEKGNLQLLSINVLQPARNKMGIPITVTSGYRSAAVNRAVKGAANSQHTRGQAADLVCANNTLLFNTIKNNGNFDQLIWEAGNDIAPAWVHVSYKASGNRGQVLKMLNGKYTIL